MGQLDVYEFLEDNPDLWFTSSEISREIDVSIPSTTISLKRLRETSEVIFRGSGRRGDEYRYKFKG